MAQLILITVNTGRFAHMSYVGGVGNGDGDLSGIPLAGEGLGRIRLDGTAVVRSGTHELGIPTYTVMTRIAAEALGVPASKVKFELGCTGQPEAPISGGSQTVASVGPAMFAAATAARNKLIAMAVADATSPLHSLDLGAITTDNGRRIARNRADQRGLMATVIESHGGIHSFVAVFVEVHVDPGVGTIRVPRVVGAYGVGKLMNKKTGRSQLMGRIVWGLGMGLIEKTEIDCRTGRPLNANLADYHVKVNADIGKIDVTVVEESGPHVNVLGAKGIGEIGIVGVAAALANAVCHATGRDLPIARQAAVDRTNLQTKKTACARGGLGRRGRTRGFSSDEKKPSISAGFSSYN